MSDNASIDFECPQCQKRLRAPGSAAGKRTRCPKCSNVVTVPAETATTAAPLKLSPKPPPPPEPDSPAEPSRDDDESDRPRRRRRLTRDDDEDDDESDRPRRRRRPTRDDDDDESDRPRRRRRSTRDDDDDDDGVHRDTRLGRRLRRRPTSTGLIAAAICMIVVASLGLLLDLLGTVTALVGPEQPINPQDPPFVQQIAKNMHGPLASATQAFFALLSVLTIIGSIQRLRQKTWGLALAACILAMINIGNCCCFLGLPVGIWAMVMLLIPEIQEGFS